MARIKFSAYDPDKRERIIQRVWLRLGIDVPESCRRDLHREWSEAVKNLTMDEIKRAVDTWSKQSPVTCTAEEFAEAGKKPLSDVAQRELAKMKKLCKDIKMRDSE